MMDELLELLRFSEADAWTVSDEKKYGWEFYFIRHRLDQNRIVNTRHIKVTVYKKLENGKYLGSASGEIPPTAGREEAAETIAELLERAAYVRNPAYALRKPVHFAEVAGEEADAERKDGVGDETPEHGSSAKEEETSGRLSSSKEEVTAVSRDFIEAMQHVPETGTEDVNSYEIFVNQFERRLVTSNGIDETERFPSSMIEVVVNARNEEYRKTHIAGNGAVEIELYRMYNSGTCDREALQRDITRTMTFGRDRLLAVPTPPVGRIPVIFSTADAVELYDYFLSRMNAQLIYQKISSAEAGRPVLDGMEGDSLTIRALSYLPNSSQNYVFDEEGAPIRDCVLIKENRAERFWGSAMFSDYLGLRDTFLVSNYAVDGGEESAEELRAGRYLEIVEFSDFQVDTMTGAIFGEIRLGYLHEEDGNVSIVTGGSISGSMVEYGKRMRFSREIVQYDHARVPAVTKLENVTVAGSGLCVERN